MYVLCLTSRSNLIEKYPTKGINKDYIIFLLSKTMSLVTLISFGEYLNKIKPVDVLILVAQPKFRLHVSRMKIFDENKENAYVYFGGEVVFQLGHMYLVSLSFEPIND